MRKGQFNSRQASGRNAGALILLVFALCGAMLFPLNQLEAAPQEPASQRRLLSFEEGVTIVHAAKEYQRHAVGKPDCSHLAHEVYLLSGFPYFYESSFDLFSGSDNFVRVKSAQPGDLIVWPGHVGIVFDPVQHTFYSSVRSGLRAEFYDGRYWRGRGKPRFYRYIVGSLGSLGSPGLKTANYGNPKNPDSTQVLTVPIIEKSADTPRPSPTRRGKLDSKAEVVDSLVPATAATVFEIPPSILIETKQARPSSEEVADGISEVSDTSGNLLRADDLSKLRLPVVIYDQLNVERVEIKRDRGWAQVRMDCRASITAGRTDLKHRRETIRWELRRTESGWIGITPVDRAYVPRDVAVRNLAAQLARLTQSDSAANHEDAALRQEAQLASLLNELLKKR